MITRATCTCDLRTSAQRINSWYFKAYTRVEYSFYICINSCIVAVGTLCTAVVQNVIIENKS